MTKCQFPDCEEAGEFDEEVALSEQDEDVIDVTFCTLHYVYLLKYNHDDWEALDYENELTEAQRVELARLLNAKE